MRTTVEITERQHEALSALARRRGIRGFSPLVQEAIDAYLGEIDGAEVNLLLSLEGSLSDDLAQELRSRIAEARAVWRAS